MFVLQEDKLYFNNQLIGPINKLHKIHYPDAIDITNMFFADDDDMVDAIMKHDLNKFIEVCKNRLPYIEDINKIDVASQKRNLILKLNTETLKMISPFSLLISLIIKDVDKYEQSKKIYSYTIDFLRQVNPLLLNYISNNLRNTLYNNKGILSVLRDMLSIDEYDDILHIINDIIISAFTSKRWFVDNKLIGLQAIGAVVNRSLSLLIMRKARYDVRYIDKVASTTDTRTYFIANILKKEIVKNIDIQQDINQADIIRQDNFVYRYFILPVLSVKYGESKSLMLLDDKTRTLITYALINEIDRVDLRKALTKLLKENITITFTKKLPTVEEMNVIYVMEKIITKGYIQYHIQFRGRKFIYSISKLQKFLQKNNPILKQYISQSTYLEQYLLLVFAIFHVASKVLLKDYNTDVLLNYIMRVYQRIIRSSVQEICRV
jgi:hypothetical protein